MNTIWLVWEKDEDRRYLMEIFTSKEKADAFVKSVSHRKAEGYIVSQWTVR